MNKVISILAIIITSAFVGMDNVFAGIGDDTGPFGDKKETTLPSEEAPSDNSSSSPFNSSPFGSEEEEQQILSPAPPPAVPIDGGAGLLIAAGVGVGLRTLKRKKTHNAINS